MTTFRGAAAFVTLIFVAGLGEPALAQSTADRCARLAGLAIPREQIGLPTSGAVIREAAVDIAAIKSGQLCVVKGEIAPVDPAAPPIRFEVDLPEAWNGKAIQMGGGGYNGVVTATTRHAFIPKDRNPIDLGYVSFGSDSGHSAGNGDFGKAARDASFAMNAEARENFAYAQIKKTRDTVWAVVRAYYRSSPRRTYFYGSSQGGHEALLAAQRFPEDYDGVVAIHPAYNFIALASGSRSAAEAIYKDPKGWIRDSDARILGNAVLQSCDKLDGLADGIIANVAKCRKTFSLASLACTKPSDDACLNAAQIEAIRQLAAPADLGMKIGETTHFGPWPVLEGAFTYPGLFGFGKKAVPDDPPSGDDAFLYVMGDQGVRYLITQNPAIKSLSFRPAEHRALVERASAATDVTSDFDRFRARGGKILMMHGSVDMAIAPANSVALDERLSKRYGKGLNSFYRFYMAYGFGHGDGAFQVEWAAIDELDRWVEQGVAPGPQVVRDTSEAGNGRTMPLCRFPLWPRYRGDGDPGSDSSFRCVR